MIITAVELFAEHMRGCLLVGGGVVGADVMRARLVANLRHLREAYDCLLKLDLPSQVKFPFNISSEPFCDIEMKQV